MRQITLGNLPMYISPLQYSNVSTQVLWHLYVQNNQNISEHSLEFPNFI